jgi:hypothetical protein
MRCAIQLPDKTFAAFQFKVGTNKSYLMPVNESVDAHDFRSEDKAKAWLRGRRIKGELIELTDSGHWPCED